MQIAIISTVLAIVLFLFLYKFHKDEVSRLSREIEWLKNGISHEIEKYQTRLTDCQKAKDEFAEKLYSYMDMTRKESLDSYRRGLQDGVFIAESKPVYAPQNPVKTMEEHETEVNETKAATEANKAFAEGFSAIMNYDGSIPKEG